MRGLKELAVNINGINIDNMENEESEEDFAVLQRLESQYNRPPTVRFNVDVFFVSTNAARRNDKEYHLFMNLLTTLMFF